MSMINIEERLRQPLPHDPIQKHGDDEGPTKPDVKRPDSSELIRRMRQIDPDQAKRYRQRSGQ